MPADPPALAAEIRRRLGPPPELPGWPMVSMVVLNRDGAALLRRMLAGLVESTDYPHLELILVDNGSSDDSLDFVRGVEAPFPIPILANPRNESFSDGCNQGAELASGELLLFLNNDTEPFEPGWLRELVACLRRSGAGAVASTLVCPDHEHEASFRYGYGVQHRGLEFRAEEDGTIYPALRGWEDDPLDERLGEDAEPRAVAAACMMVRRDAFESVGGFSQGYLYGAEDADLCLKLRAAGLPVLLSGRSIVIHHPVSTRRRGAFEEERARKLANRRVLWERWGPRLRRDYELARPGSDGI
jgi:GT2 family glycosyltransferase